MAAYGFTLLKFWKPTVSLGGKTGISFYLMDDTGENTLSDEAFGSGLANRYTDIKNDNHRT